MTSISIQKRDKLSVISKLGAQNPTRQFVSVAALAETFACCSGSLFNSQSSSLARMTDKALNLFSAIQQGEIAIVKVVQPDFDGGT